MRILPAVTFEPDLFEPVLRALFAFLAADALNLEAVGHIVEHTAVREQAKALEHHAHLLLAEAFELAIAQRHDVDVVHTDMARGGLDQAVEVADQRGLARADRPMIT